MFILAGVALIVGAFLLAATQEISFSSWLTSALLGVAAIAVSIARKIMTSPASAPTNIPPELQSAIRTLRRKLVATTIILFPTVFLGHLLLKYGESMLFLWIIFPIYFIGPWALSEAVTKSLFGQATAHERLRSLTVRYLVGLALLLTALYFVT